MAKERLDRLDKQILKLVSADARIPFLEVARACDVSGAAIHQRIQKLTNMGILKGSQFLIDPEKVGYETCAFIGLNLKNPESFDRVVEELEKIPEVTECHYTTGNFDMFITTLPESMRCSSRYTHRIIIICSPLSTTSCSLWDSAVRRR